MIQIIGYRTYFCQTEHKEKIASKFHDKNWRAKSTKDLFDNLDKYIEQIPENERYNIHFTQANCKAGEREFDSQKVIVFDVDGIDVEQITKYEDIVLNVIGLTRDSVAISHSGHGLHVFVELKKAITKQTFFKDNRKCYKHILAKINYEIKKLA